jgi:folate-binding protein YgfZ
MLVILALWCDRMSLPSSENRFALSVLRVRGPDARTFLQSQLTSQIESIEEAFVPTAWCNPKGRVQAIMLISGRDERFDLVLPAPIADTVLKRLGMFRIGRRVEIEAVGTAQPAAPGDRGALPLALDTDRALRVSDERCSPLPSNWLRRDIDCSLPWVLPPAQARFLPQMLGLDALGGLSYRKGCFPGQEVIARVHYRGRVTLRPARIDISERTARPGAEIRFSSGTGTVLYAVPESDRFGERDAIRGVRYDALAVVPSEATAGDEISDDGRIGVLVN